MSGTVLLIEDEESIATVVRAYLERDGYKDLAADPKAVATIKVAGDSGNVMVWTNLHIVVNVDPVIDARPQN